MKPKCINLTIFITLLFSHFQATEKLQNQFFFDFLIFLNSAFWRNFASKRKGKQTFV